MDLGNALPTIVGLLVVAGFGWFLWDKIKDARKENTGDDGGSVPGGGGGGEDPRPPVDYKNVVDYVSVLFDNPKKVVYVLVVFVLMMLALYAIPHRGEASELYFDAGAAVVRGETPTLGVNITFPRMGPANTDYEVGFNLIGQSDHYRHNPNQFVVHGMLVDGYKNLELGMGFAYFNVPSEYNCQFTYSLLGRWRFNERFHAQWHHFSTAGSCKPNAGRDLLTFGYRF